MSMDTLCGRRVWTGLGVVLLLSILPAMVHGEDRVLSPGTPILEAIQQANRQIADAVRPCIVNVSCERETQTPDILTEAHPFFPDTFETQSTGSGVIIDARAGYILTNHHVIEGARTIQVTVRHNGSEKVVSARALGSDRQSELGVIQIDEADLEDLHLQEAVLGDSNGVEVGDLVYAVGNPFGYPQTFNFGIVTGVGRWWSKRPRIGFMQTDASVNPGNSGGALVDIYGRVIGINTFIASTSGGSEGIGFAIPINDARDALPELIEKGYITYGFVGVQPASMQEAILSLGETDAAASLPTDRRGAWVFEVERGSPADVAGVRKGDTIRRVGDRAVNTPHDLYLAVKRMPLDVETAMVVWRPGEGELPLLVRIAELASDRNIGSARAEGLLGLSLRPLRDRESASYGLRRRGGLLVEGVREGSAAEVSGIEAGDVITELERSPVRDLDMFRNLLSDARRKEGRPAVRISLRRGEQDLFKTVKVE